MPDPYFSEIKYLGGPTLDFIEVAVDAGADVSNLVVTIYNANGSVRSSNAVSGLTPTTIAGRDVYVIESGAPASFTGLGKTNGLALSDGGTVYEFVSFNDNAASVTATAGPANGLTSTEIGMAGAGESLETTDRGASYYVQTTPNDGTIPCLTTGTLVQTRHGEMFVDDLPEGTDLLSADGHFAALRVAMKKRVTAAQMRANPKLRPIRICAHALGHGLPKRDLLVSRQHRMLVQTPIVQRMFGQRSVLIPAVKLLTLPGIYVDEDVSEVTYVHLLFDAHEVIFAEGAPTESLYLGREAVKALPKPSLDEILKLFPDAIGTATAARSARLIPPLRAQKRLLARHAKNRMPILKAYRAQA